MNLILLFIVAGFLAYNNGANDNFKGVATLFGSKTTQYKTAIQWATITTFLGSAASIFLASALVKNFSGKGLVPDELLLTPEFAISIALGAGLTVYIATHIGMPVSTTHSLVGALFGSGVVAVGSMFNFARLTGTFLFPLIVSPILAAALSIGVYFIIHQIRIYSGISKETCVCVGDVYKPGYEISQMEGTATIADDIHSTVVISDENNCIEIYSGRFIGISFQKILDYTHFMSAGIVSFSRGLNDTPKIVGLLILINTLDIKWSMFAVALAIAVGGLINAKKVGETIGNKITPLNHGQGLTANIITGLLVTTASLHGLPVSTTHVSVGSIFGIGTVTKNSNLQVVANILLSWVLTLPVGAICGAAVYWVLLQI